ncbi:MAG: GAF domain-containing protein [Anaerolineae bacterium]
MAHLIWPNQKTTETEPLNANRHQSLNVLLPGYALSLLIGLGTILFSTNFAFSGRIVLWIVLFLASAFAAWSRTSSFQLRATIFTVALLITGVDQLIVNGPQSWSVLILAIVPLMATVHLGIRAGLLSLFVTLIAMISPTLFNIAPAVSSVQNPLSTYWYIIIILFALIALAGQISLDRLVKQMELARTREHELAQSLEEESKRFDERVAVRTQAIKTSSLISQRIASILDEQSLMQEVVSQLQQETGYYYAQIYLRDEFASFDTLYLVADSDRQGRSYIPKGYRLPVFSGLIGEVLQSKTSILVEDLPASGYTIPGDPIPNSISELAVPIKLGDEVLGILDIRQNYVDGLDQDDIFLIEAVASQLAVGIRNARLYARAQKQAMREVLVNSVREQLQSAESVQDAVEIATRAISNELQTGTRVSIGLSG